VTDLDTLAERHAYCKSTNFYLTRRHRISKLPSAAQMKLRLHSKPVAAMRLSEILGTMEVDDPPRAARIAELLLIMRHTLATLADSKRPVLRMQSHHADLMASDGLLEGFDTSASTTPYTFAESFLVVEEAKDRLRQIHWPKTALRQSVYRSDFSLRGSAAIRALIEEFVADHPEDKTTSPRRSDKD
jgi:hypothetical protein